MEVNESSCQNINCEDGPHEMCHNCNPQYETRQDCVVCSSPSNGGRLTCCKEPICYPCFNKFFKMEYNDKPMNYFGLTFMAKEGKVVSTCPVTTNELHLMDGYVKVNER